ncbi:MAG TPA: alanine--tRNA ligase [Verrucomicrobiales bacterium]|nr:alanine--tRNA ligase [Verrucomicrobiales bacterium]
MTAAEIRQSFLSFFEEKEHSVVPSASLLPQSPGLLFTNAGMNQFVPYFLGTEKAPYAPPRAVDTQKCIRAGGKHNDLEDVGQDSYHHTFFEMLGNWSFGNYFKRDAITWAWELMVERWGFPPERLYATVYRPGPGDPADFDQEAYDYWKALFEKAGCDPGVHIVDGNKADNFWMMGETGPCGPCSELHVDLTPEGDTGGLLVNKDSDQCIEIWNLVFIQFNAEADGSFRDLPSTHVDTGMGFERACSIIQNTKGFTDFSQKASNYNTDVFRPIFDTLEELSGKTYQDVYPGPDQEAPEEVVKTAVAFRVIADHLRTLSFSIADGILPGNTGRNYVLRRILRRAVRYGRSLGFTGDKFVLTALVNSLVTQMKEAFPELKARESVIVETLQREERSFNETLDRGLNLFEEEASKLTGTAFPAEAAFKLYDTFGFPVDLTQLLCRERGIPLEMSRFEELMEQARQIARKAQKSEIVSALDISTQVSTEFIGFEQDSCEATILEVHIEGDLCWLLTDRSPFYAEMGGQVGDTGALMTGNAEIPVVALQQIGSARAHGVHAEQATTLKAGDKVTLSIHGARRRPIEAHHTATHLLHWALHEIVSPEATQQGSLVAEDRLRFDFTSSAVSAEQVAALEEQVNARIEASEVVSWQEVPFEKVQGREDIMQFFGDKYGNKVRVVQIGGEPQALNGYSMELCGGAHVRNTAEIGLFKIRREEAIAAGTRRIEAVCGAAAEAYLVELEEQEAEEKRAALAKLSAANEGLSALGAEQLKPVDDADAAVIKSTAVEAEKALKKAQAANAAQQADTFLAALLEGDTHPPAIVESLEGPPALLQELLNGLKKAGFIGSAVLVVDDGEKLHLGALCGSEGQSTGNRAGDLIKTLAPLVGGKGGGKPDMARGAGADRSGKNNLLAAARAEFQ